jgi:hypothetical protein
VLERVALHAQASTAKCDVTRIQKTAPLFGFFSSVFHFSAGICPTSISADVLTEAD